MAASFPLPPNLPVPQDDGGCAHLTPGTPLPSGIQLQSCDGNGRLVDISTIEGITLLYFYPMTGIPGQPLPDGWDAIPGARGCTPQSCSFRDHFQELRSLGVAEVFGICTQSTEIQREARERLHLPFPLLSDEHAKLIEALRLPTFQVEGKNLVKRITILVKNAKIWKVWYPVWPPDQNAQDVVNWLKANPE